MPVNELLQQSGKHRIKHFQRRCLENHIAKREEIAFILPVKSTGWRYPAKTDIASFGREQTY